MSGPRTGPHARRLLVALVPAALLAGGTLSNVAAAPPSPTVTSVVPTASSECGGYQVTVNGSGLGGATAINFGSTPASQIISTSNASVVVIAPAHDPATVDVTVTTTHGTSATSASDQFTFTDAAPTLTGIAPSTGSTTGGTTVTLTGTCFVDGANIASVNFGSGPGSSVTPTSVTPTSVVATSPSEPAAVVNVTVSTVGSTSALAQTSNPESYTYTLAPGTSWLTLSGRGSDIGVGADGSAWLVGTYPVPGGYGIFKWNGSSWGSVPGGAVRITVDASGSPWIVNSTGHIFRWIAGSWQVLPGLATDIGAGPDGMGGTAVWILGAYPVAGGYGVFEWNGTGWTSMPGGGVRIADGPDGNPWLVNDRGAIFHLVSGAWTAQSGCAKDVGVGSDGILWVVGCNPVAGGYGIYVLENSSWANIDGGATNISVEPDGLPWVVNSAGAIFQRT